MLCLSRKQGESIKVGSDIEITVTRIGGKNVRLNVKAPAGVRILRSELDERDVSDERKAG